MPNKPQSPYGRFPLRAAIGLALMAGAPAIYIIAQLSSRDWRIALAVTLSLLASAAILYAAVKGWQWIRVRLSARTGKPRAAPSHTSVSRPAITHDKPQALPGRRPQPRSPGFDAEQFMASVRARHPASPEDDDRPAQINQERIRKLEDLRDHPATPEPEKRAADRSIKRMRKRRPLPDRRKP